MADTYVSMQNMSEGSFPRVVLPGDVVATPHDEGDGKEAIRLRIGPALRQVYEGDCLKACMHRVSSPITDLIAIALAAEGNQVWRGAKQAKLVLDRRQPEEGLRHSCLFLF